MIDLTKDHIKKAINSYYKDFPEKLATTVPQHFEGVHEDGTRYSYWKIGNIITGDAGKELFDKAILDLFKSPEKY